MIYKRWARVFEALDKTIILSYLDDSIFYSMLNYSHFTANRCACKELRVYGRVKPNKGPEFPPTIFFKLNMDAFIISKLLSSLCLTNDAKNQCCKPVPKKESIF